MYGLAKIARSWQAKQRRLYERMLKSLHGGTEGYMEHVRQSGNRKWPEIFHGGKSTDLKKIMSDGIDENYVGDTIYGPGLYFGTEDVAKRYARDAAIRFKTPSEMTDTLVSYPKPNRVLAIDFNKKHPNFSQYAISKTLLQDIFPKQIEPTNQLMYYGLINNKNIFDYSKTMGGRQFHVTQKGGLSPKLFNFHDVIEDYDPIKDDFIKLVVR